MNLFFMFTVESVASKREVPNPTEILKEDARIFQVNEWYLQPSFK